MSGLIGGVVNSVVGGLFGGGSSSSGTGSSDAWVTQPMSPGSYAQVTAAAQSTQVTWQAVLAGLVGTYALVKQYDLQRRIVDLYERGVNQAEEYLTLAKRNYNEITVPAFTRQRANYDYVVSNWRPKLNNYITEAMRLKAYTPDYATQMGRAMSTTQAEFAKARRLRALTRGRFELGRACYEDALFSIRGAEARVAAASAAMRYEDIKRVELDKWYWTRWSNAAEAMGSALANASSGLNSGVSLASTSINSIGAAVQRSGTALAGLGGAEGEMGGFYKAASGQLSQALGYNQMRSALPAASTVSPSTISAIGSGATNGVASFVSGWPGSLGSTSYISGRNSGEAPI